MKISKDKNKATYSRMYLVPHLVYLKFLNSLDQFERDKMSKLNSSSTLSSTDDFKKGNLLGDISPVDAARRDEGARKDFGTPAMPLKPQQTSTPLDENVKARTDSIFHTPGSSKNDSTLSSPAPAKEPEEDLYCSKCSAKFTKKTDFTKHKRKEHDKVKLTYAPPSPISLRTRKKSSVIKASKMIKKSSAEGYSLWGKK